ncbi:hypothetical protein C5O27_00935 [Gordonia alkanivorans]|uniref:DUF3376 domain-containing protein n=1 Tax=Gordonia alkanivorans TaxID=84096 RepID=UPI000FDD7DD9|nr:DUF3376 domain-containing protein [Gordonia alkanivorans]AZZ79834.1 hypothetical protein C5O27_00935 [Gordonia alkanivorans]
MTIDDGTTFDESPAPVPAVEEPRRIPTPTRKTLRVALAMRGGVSMAVWIGGAVAELDLLRRVSRGAERCACAQWPPRSPQCVDSATPRQRRAHLYRRRLAEAGYTDVEFDILAGASAGGLNAMLFALTQTYGVPTDDLVSRLWSEQGDLWELVREPGWGPVPSVLKGNERLLDVAEQAVLGIAGLGRNSGTPKYADSEIAAIDSVTVELAATLLTDGKQPELGNRASFSFTRRPGGLTSRYSTVPGPETVEVRMELRRMALAARATSSFPGAFEPADIYSATDGSTCGWKQLSRKGKESPRDCVPNMVAVFPFARAGAASSPAVRPGDEFRVVDGGVVDNIPIDRALRAVQRASASSPSRRVLVYLDPQPPQPPVPRKAVVAGNRDSGAGWLSVIMGAKGLQKRVESADDEIDQIREHNDAALEAASRQRELAATLSAALGNGRKVERVDVATYIRSRSGIDVQRLSNLVVDPTAYLCRPPHRSRIFPTVNRLDALCVERAVREAYGEIAGGAHPDASAVFDAGDVGAAVAGIRLFIAWVQQLQAMSTGSTVAEPVPLRRLKKGLYRCLTVMIEARRLTVDMALLLKDSTRVDCDEVVSRIIGGIESQGRLEINSIVDVAMTPAGVTEIAEATFYQVLAPVEGAPGVQLGEAKGDALHSVWATLSQYRTRILEWTVNPAESPGPALERWNNSIFHLLHDGLGEDEGDAAPENVVFDIVRLVGEAAIPGTAATIGFHRITGDTKPRLKFDGHEDGTPPAGDVSLAEVRKAAIAAQLQKWIRGDVDPGSLNADAVATQIDATANLARADTRLAGTGLARFAGFLSPEWRENDWHWGRLDAAAGVVDLLSTTSESTTVVSREDDEQLITELQEEVTRETTPSGVSAGAHIAATGGQTLSHLDVRYVFGLVSRILPLVLRALWPAERSGGTAKGVAVRVGLVAARPLLPIISLALDRVRLVSAVVVAVAAAALLGTGTTAPGVQATFVGITAVLGGLLIWRAIEARRRWGMVREFFTARAPERKPETDELWTTTLNGSEKYAKRFAIGAFVAGAFALVVAALWIWWRSNAVPALGAESLVMTVLLFAGLVGWCNLGAQTVRARPRRRKEVRIGLITAVVVIYLPIFGVTWMSIEDMASGKKSSDLAQLFTQPTAGEAAGIAAATVLLLTLLSLWGWARWGDIAGCAVGLAVIAGITQWALETFFSESPLLDLLPTAVWAVGVGIALQFVHPVGRDKL